MQCRRGIPLAMGIENTFIFVEFAFNSCQIYTMALLWPPLGVGPKPRRPDLIFTTLVSVLQGWVTYSTLYS